MSMFVVRDRQGYAVLFTFQKPTRNEEHGIWVSEDNKCTEIPKDLFPDLTWESEPLEIGLCQMNEKYQTVKVEVLDRLFTAESDMQNLKTRVSSYQSLPWYKRLFKDV